MNTTFTIAVRPELAVFAEHMERVLRANDHKDDWHRMSFESLFNRAVEELDELQRAITCTRDPVKIAKRATNVANYMLMITDNATCLPQRKPQPTNHEATP